jgi:hypothetical protein
MEQEHQKIIEAYCTAAIAAKSGKAYYDVEIELFDHMIEWVEQQQKATGEDFESCFALMKAVFPVSDCKKIVEAKSKAITQRMLRDCYKEFLNYFSWPKIGFTFLLVAIIIWLDNHVNISKFPSTAIHFLNITSLYLFKRGNIIYNNKTEKKAQLISLRKADFFQLYFFMPSIGYLILSFFSIDDYPMPIIVYKIALYIFPLLLLFLLASRATNIAEHEKIRANYPGAFCR